MKCLLFIISLGSIGRYIDVQGENDADANLFFDDPISFEITEDNVSEESARSAYDNMNDRRGDENSSEAARSKERTKETMNFFLAEMQAGDNADLIGHNQHIEQSNLYKDLGRRSVAQVLQNIAAENVDYLTPEKAPPELVLLVAKESALLRAGKDTDPGSDFDREKILRSGDYWNGAWKDEVNPKRAMRSASQKKKLGSIKAKINPGTEFYKVVSRMKKISPQLLYIINKKQP